jgi:YD repeat-containing protein
VRALPGRTLIGYERTSSKTHDAAGRRTVVTGPDGYAVTNVLDLLGRVTVTADSGGARTTNWFNNQGNRYASSNAWGRVAYAEFDIDDRVVSQTDANGVTVTNAYDAAGRLTKRVYTANGATETYGHTLNISGATSYTNALTNVTLYAFDAFGRKLNEVSVSICRWTVSSPQWPVYPPDRSDRGE